MSKRRYTQTYASQNEEESKLSVYYCLHCGSYAIILDIQLSALPKRHTDKSLVLEENKILKKSMVPGEVKVIKRQNGMERQYRLNCSECGLWVAYRPVDFQQPSKYMYILPDALGTRQELAMGLKHYSLSELKGQLATIFGKLEEEDGGDVAHDAGLPCSGLLSLFKEHFGYDLRPEDYGDFKNIIDLLKALPEVVRVAKEDSVPTLAKQKIPAQSNQKIPSAASTASADCMVYPSESYKRSRPNNSKPVNTTSSSSSSSSTSSSNTNANVKTDGNTSPPPLPTPTPTQTPTSSSLKGNAKPSLVVPTVTVVAKSSSSK